MTIVNGMVFDIQRFSTHDGPGIRTTVFLKGCTMRCLWCHNPESIQPEPELQVFPGKCIGCSKCIQVCPAGAHQIQGGQKGFDRAKCIRCGKCAESCCADALVLTGRSMSADEVMEVIEKDRAFYGKSGGGVTFSGGEPVLQIGFLAGLLKECKRRGLHTVVETSGNVPWTSLLEIVPCTDLFLYDLKAMDETVHRHATGAGNKRILENLCKLSAQGAFVHVRVPVIPGVNNTYENMEAMSDFILGIHGVEQVEFIPFHRMASAKYESLDLEYSARDIVPPEKSELAAWAEFFTCRGIKASVS